MLSCDAIGGDLSLLLAYQDLVHCLNCDLTFSDPAGHELEAIASALNETGVRGGVPGLLIA